jgi:ribosomal protein S18 acetylase RimI-like enzyme
MLDYLVFSLTPTVLAKYQEAVKNLYQVFTNQAQTTYEWELPPSPWDSIILALRQGTLHGVLVLEATMDPVALLITENTPHGVLEINVLITATPDLAGNKGILNALMRFWLPQALAQPNWTVISFAMLGCQAKWVHTIGWYGFQLSGQAIVSLNFTDWASVQVLSKQQPKTLSPDFTLSSWTILSDEQKSNVPAVIHKAFAQTHDTLWDPRLMTLAGCNTIMDLLVNDQLGQHLDHCSQVLLHQTQPIGFCFLLQTGAMLGNIPLIGLHPQWHGHGLSQQLLFTTLRTVINDMMTESRLLEKITATTDTDQFAALRLYRKLGFQEVSHYPHAYQTRQSLASKQGQWVWC